MPTKSERKLQYNRERQRRLRAAMTFEERQAARHRLSDLADQARRRQRRLDTLREYGFELNSETS